MANRSLLRVLILSLLAFLFAGSAEASSPAPRDDVGVAAVDTKTGKVVWEAWRLDEVPAETSKEQKAAVEYLLVIGKIRDGSAPKVALLKEAPHKDFGEKDVWAENDPWSGNRGAVAASEGKTLTYYRHQNGIIAIDRQTKKEVWR